MILLSAANAAALPPQPGSAPAATSAPASAAASAAAGAAASAALGPRFPQTTEPVTNGNLPDDDAMASAISSSCAASRQRCWSRASSGAAAPVEDVVGRGGAGRGRRRAWRRRSRASSGMAAPVEGVVRRGGAGRGRRRRWARRQARRRRSRAPSGAAAPVEGVVGRGGTAAGCATDDQCTNLHYRPIAAVLASTAGRSSVPCSSGSTTTCMCSTSGPVGLAWGQNYWGTGVL